MKSGTWARSASTASTRKKAWHCGGSGHGDTPRRCTASRDGRDGAQRHLEHGLRRGRTHRRTQIPHVDGAGSVHTAVPRHRRRSRAHRPRRGGNLERLRFDRGLPQRIYCDNGTEFVSAAMDLWAYSNGVVLDFSRRGKPTDNAAIESYNERFRDECLNVHWLGRWRTPAPRLRPGGRITMSTTLTELSRG